MVLVHYQLWQNFADRHHLNQHQIEQFISYYNLLNEYSKKINLTSLKTVSEIITHHFDDSLALGAIFDLTQFLKLADIGTGAGFPAIPLKIKYPHLKCYLLEVVGKKINFLHELIKELKLTTIEIVPLDWRTFLRTTNYPIDIFCARASLPPAELVRLFSPSYAYQTSTLVYWASKNWVPGQTERPFIVQEFSYLLTPTVKRQLIVFKNTRLS
jgi:16S rRNA (guanine527-N7)-methyltransferase